MVTANLVVLPLSLCMCFASWGFGFFSRRLVAFMIASMILYFEASIPLVVPLTHHCLSQSQKIDIS